MQQKSGYRIYEKIDHIISECCKLAQMDIKTRHAVVGKMIPWELR